MAAPTAPEAIALPPALGPTSAALPPSLISEANLAGPSVKTTLTAT